MIRAVLQRLGRVSQSGPDKGITTLVRREFGLRARSRTKCLRRSVHAHSMLDGDKTGLKSNERLEFLGDVVLDMTMAHYLYGIFQKPRKAS